MDKLLQPINPLDLKDSFLKCVDTDEKKLNHYRKSYYHLNKQKYRDYYNANKERIKEYARQYKKQNKKAKKKRINGFSIVHKPVVVSFGFSKNECQLEAGHKSLSQLLLLAQQVPFSHEVSVSSLQVVQPQEGEEQPQAEAQQQEEEE